MAAGFDVVINLPPHDTENSLRDEAAVVNQLAMNYIHIPVNFSKPSERKFGLYCTANMRVSAFLFRYCRDILKEDATTAKLDLDKIWQPLSVWAQFIK